MAPFSNYISFLFLTTLLLPLQITARDSQFFSKVTTNFNNNKNKETELANKEGPVTNKPEQEQQQQPAFIPETENSYGLYGHDSDHLPSTNTPNYPTYTTPTSATYTTPTTYQPHKTEFEDTSKYFNNDAFSTKYYNKDAFGNNQNELSDTKYTQEEYNSMGNQNNNHNQHNHFHNNAATERYYHNNNNNNNYNAAVNYRYNGEKQGMSDTRFLEGGKYFHDIYNEKYNPTLYGDSSREVNTNNWYNNRGNNNNYGNHNAYQNYGNNNAYQNQEEFEDEQEFEP